MISLTLFLLIKMANHFNNFERLFISFLSSFQSSNIRMRVRETNLMSSHIVQIVLCFFIFFKKEANNVVV